MTKSEGIPNSKDERAMVHQSSLRHSGFGFLSSFVLRHSSFDNRFPKDSGRTKIQRQSLFVPNLWGNPLGSTSQCIRESGRGLSMNLRPVAALTRRRYNRFMVPTK